METSTLDTPGSAGLNIDTENSAYLLEAAKWAKFLAIIGFIFCGLIALVGIFAGSIFSSLSSMTGNAFPMEGMGAGIGVFYILIALLYFFPALYLFKFATRMKAALQGSQQHALNDSFRNIKSCFKFMGILMIIVLGFYVLAMIVFVTAGTMMM